VTTPHKVAVAELVESEEPSVNTLLVRDGSFVGVSTDSAIREELDFRRVAIIGNGGAAVAFAAALPDADLFARRGEWPPRVEDVDLIINATSERDEVVVAAGAGQTLVDLPYPPTATARAAAANGARVVDGLEVLVAQGAVSFELWTGVPAPIEVMRAAVRSA
jgi:shikimate dehydrogenase